MQINKLLANSGNYTKGRGKGIKYIVVHYTANNGDTAKGNCNYFATGGRNASAHYFVDENSIYQSVADSDTAWAVGANTYIHADCRNNNSISVEMCSRIGTDGKYYIKADIISNAVELVKELMVKHNVPITNVLRHYDVTGKKCPEPFVRDTAQWTAFKKRLEDEEMDQSTFNSMIETYFASLKAEDPSIWSKDARKWAEEKGIITGDESGNMNYKGFVTREQLVVFLKRIAG